MSQFGAPLAVYYDPRVVALSFLISILSSYVALDLAVRVTAARGRVRRAWLAGGAISMGFGIWSTHFVGMLAFKLPIPVRYDVLTVLLSLFVAIPASSIALHLSSGERFGRREALVGSLMMGSGIAAMHYLGMAAMRLPATCHYKPLLVGLSIMIAVVAALAALTFTFDFHEESRGTWAKATAAVVMGIAISSMHYTGMASASFATSNLTVDFSHSLSISWLGTAGIVIVTLMTLGFTLLMTFMGRQFAAQALQLQSSEQLMQQSHAVINAIPQQIWSGPADGTLDFCNERWRSYIGLGLEELRGDGWQRMLHPDDRDRVLKAWHESVANGTPYEQEERHRGADGQYRWFLARGVPLRDGGRIIRWYGTNTDIEDLKLAEEAVKQAEDRIRLIINTIPTMAWSIRPDGAVDFVNQRWLDYTGLTLDEEVEQPARPVHPEDLPRVMEKWLADMAAGEPSEDEMRLRRADGEYRWFLVRTAPLRDERGNVVKWYGVCIDIEDRKTADEERKRGEVYLDMAQRMAQMGVWSWNPSSGEMFGSQELYRILGINPSETKLTREIFAQSIHPEDRSRYDSEINAAFKEKRNWEIDYRIVLTDGSLKYIQGIGRPVFASSGELLEFVGTTVDITDRKHAEEELRRLSGQLLRLQDEERRKIARDLHDSTGQDLVALATTLGQLHHSIPSSARRSRKLFSMCRALAERSIREIRTLSYLLHPPMLDEAGLVEALRHFTAGFAERTGIEVDLEVAPHFGRLTPEMELGLFRMVQECLINIQRHSGSFTAKIRVDRNPDKITLQVSDAGRGISASKQVQNGTIPKPVGVGIPSMQERAMQIGGRLEIDSSANGTTVRITIPVEGKRK